MNVDDGLDGGYGTWQTSFRRGKNSFLSKEMAFFFFTMFKILTNLITNESTVSVTTCHIISVLINSFVSKQSQAVTKHFTHQVHRPDDDTHAGVKKHHQR